MLPGRHLVDARLNSRRNILDKTPASYRDRMHELLDQILKADSQQTARQRLEEVSPELSEKAPTALEVLEEGIFEATAVLALPEKYCERLRWADMLDRPIQEIRRREKVFGIFPNRSSACRLVGALLAEKHEEWATGRRWLKMDAYYEWRDRSTEEEKEELRTKPDNRTLQPA